MSSDDQAFYLIRSARALREEVDVTVTLTWVEELERKVGR